MGLQEADTVVLPKKYHHRPCKSATAVRAFKSVDPQQTNCFFCIEEAHFVPRGSTKRTRRYSVQNIIIRGWDLCWWCKCGWLVAPLRRAVNCTLFFRARMLLPAMVQSNKLASFVQPPCHRTKKSQKKVSKPGSAGVQPVRSPDQNQES